MFDFSITNGIDMTIKKFFLFFVFTLKVQLFSFFLIGITLAQPASEQAVLSNQVQQLSKVNDEDIDFDTVHSLSEKIINHHQYYSNDILAKVYLLSARVASNQGNINEVFDFAKKGLAANSLDKKIKLALLFKLADVYVAKKEYKKLLEVTQEAVRNSEYSRSIKYRILSLSYRSVAFSMLGKHQQALVDLQQVELSISKSDLTEHIELLTILALAYHHLGDYQTSLTMQLKILKLRFEMGQKKNIAQTYLYLGYAYFYLQRFDDAYNVFWESKKSALHNGATINAAHADRWLGIVLISQGQFSAAFEPLQQAIDIFNQHNMLAERIEASVALVSAKLGGNQTSEGYALLVEVVKLLNGKEIALEYTGFYRMVAEMHFSQGNYQLAYRWRDKYSQILLFKLNNKKKSFSIVQGLSHLAVGKVAKVEPVEESKRLAVKLAESSELSSSFTGKYQKQRAVIITLSAVTSILLLIIIALFWKLRVKKVNSAYEEVEKPSYAMPTPMQTKFNYQLVFKKARKFQYPLNVGYLVVENWQEIIFHFNNKSINEVTKDLASVINEYIKDFDYVGMLNEGEYLLLFEHQSNQEANDKLDKLVQAINTRSFANLGDFTVAMKYSVNMADFKDIDPYLFLARIAESVNISQVNSSKVP